MKQAFLAGYTSRKPQQLARLAEALDAVVIDSRFSPMSRVPYWTQRALQSVLGQRYRHVKEFGNVTYKTHGVITLADPAAGTRAIGDIDRVIILCACKDGATCHRRQVGEYLTAHGWAVREVADQEWREAAIIADRQ